MGKRLTEEKQQDDIIGRLGGDEFLVASLSTSHRAGFNAQVTLLKTSLSACIAGEYWLGSVNLIYPGASVGVIEVDPRVTDPDSALRDADVAMYQDKKGKIETRFRTMY